MQTHNSECYTLGSKKVKNKKHNYNYSFENTLFFGQSLRGTHRTVLCVCVHTHTHMVPYIIHTTYVHYMYIIHYE